jgi:hypothetical protein
MCSIFEGTRILRSPNIDFRRQIEILRRRMARGDTRATAELIDLCDRYLRIILRRRARRCGDGREEDIAITTEALIEMLLRAAISLSRGQTDAKAIQTQFGDNSRRQQR